MANLPNNSLTLHIVLATIPRTQENQFAKGIKEAFYDQHIKSTQEYYKDIHDYFSRPTDEKENLNLLYNPLAYYIFGNYDIAFITLVDSYKFAQKLFSPLKYEEADEEVSNPNSFQILTGISSSNKNDDELRDFFHKKLRAVNPVQGSFLGICNLKLNNGLLIGNGQFFFTAVSEFIHQTVEKIFKEHKPLCFSKKIKQHNECLTLQSFSWFEISLILFVEDPSLIAKVVTILRSKKVSDLSDFNDLLNNSLYNLEENKDEIEKIKNSHLFADTHTYFGVHAEEFAKPDFMKRFDGPLDLKTKIELQVKPGHLKEMIEQLSNHLNADTQQQRLEHISFITGKTDYYIPGEDNLMHHHQLVQTLNKQDNKLHKYVKKIRTKVEFVNQSFEASGNTEIIELSLGSPQRRLRDDTLDRLAIPSKKGQKISIPEINDQLKALKVSRQIRAKVIKIFYNFNIGIRDSILFIYFIDFKIFIKELIEYIDTQYQLWHDHFSWGTDNEIPDDLTVEHIERHLMKMIDVFQEGYNIRMLNCYMFEDINDFDLDFNSSIQQLLTTYNMLVINIGNLFFDKEYQYAPIVQLNLKNTVANYNSINYNVYHLMSPEFVFFTVTKEILNFFRREKSSLKKQFNELERELKKVLQQDRLFESFLKEGIIDFDYLFIDIIRFFYSCNLDFKLFSYWFWTYNFQNASLYDTSGIMGEGHFKQELFRLMFLGKLYNIQVNEDACPLPEIQNYWDRYFYEVSKRLEKIFDAEVPANKSAINKITTSASEIINTMLNKIIPKNDEGLHADMVWKEKLNPLMTATEETQLQEHIQETYNSRLLHNNFKAFRIVDPLLNRYRSNAFYYFEKKYKADLENGIPILYDASSHDNPNMFINALQHMYLKTICAENKGKVRLLRRNWQNGKPLVCFIDNDSTDYLYSIDQTGDTFFTNTSKLNTYFKIRNAVLQSLWHFSLVQKKSFIDKIRSNE